MGLELEYFLVELRDDGSIALADALDTLEKPCYDLNGLSRHYDFLTTVSRYVNELGWGNYANDHEDANGQFEQNFTYTDALTSCDRAIFFRYMAPSQEALEEKRRGGRVALDALEHGFADRRPFLADGFSIADIALYAYTHVADEGGFDLAGRPKIEAWIERVAAQPGYVPITA